MTATAMHSTLTQLEQHVRYHITRDHDADEHELVNHFLDALDLEEGDYLAILEEHRRRKRIQKTRNALESYVR